MSESRAFAELMRAAAEAPPVVALVLGSGLGAAVRRLADVLSVPFAEVPGLSAPTVAGHGGTLSLGTWASRRVLVFEGRLHFYEGHAWRDIVSPVQIAASLGARILLLTNAVGGIHDALVPGSWMAIRDHIEWTRPNCWCLPGPGADAVSRPSPYSPRLRKLLVQAALHRGMELHEGIYAAVTGPCYETPAEVRALQTWGADAVGMSTAREIQAGLEAGMECAALSCVTNRAAGLSPVPPRHDEVLLTGASQADRLGALLEEFLRLL
jgi:purine-nucleoside phosphorylase